MPWYIGVLLTVVTPLVLINIYVGKKLTRAIAEQFAFQKRRTALVLSLLLVFLNSMPIAAYITYLFGGRPAMNAFAGENRLIDIVFVYPFWVTLTIIVQTGLLYLIWDIIKLLGVKVFRGSPDRWKDYNRRATLGIALIIILYTVPAIYVQTTIPRINEQTIHIPQRFADLNGLRILHISDVQGDGRTNKAQVEEFVRIANTLDADIVMNSGDIVTSGDAYIQRTAEALSGLHTKIGRFAAVGDHDIFTGNKLKVIAAIRSMGHTMLEDTSIYIPYRSATIGLTFVTYTYRQRPTKGKLDSLISLPDSVYRILLVHQPAMPLMSLAVEKGYDLVLAGHTHGGGIAFGFPGIGYLAPASFETRYVAGLFRVGKTFINVTTGLGFTLAPIRYNAPIELSLLTLSTSGE